MATWIGIWLLIALLSVMAIVIVVIGLTRHALIVGRTAAAARDEIGPIADEISREGTRAGERAQNLKVPRPGRS
ncbi:MAG TPA: hypothetical protein VK646_03625 [Actinomycetota bacterium]|nr:hypothetical protein [Actinomycetota bacterium]